MRKNNFLKVGLVGLFSLMLTIGVNKGIEVKEVKAADEVALIGKTETIVTDSSYSTYNDDNWVLTFGGNNQSGGTNSKNRSKCKLTGNSVKYADGTNVTTSDTAFALATKSSYENISRVTVQYTGGSYSGALLYLNYSNDGTNYIPVSLTSGTQGMEANATNTIYEMDFEPITDASYFAIIFKDTGSSGNFRLDYITVTLYSELYEQEGTVTGINLDASTMPTEVYTGSQWDTSGIIVTASYDDNSTANVTTFSEITLNPEVAPLTTGETTVTVTASYETFTASKQFTVNVIEAPVYDVDFTEDVSSNPFDANGINWAYYMDAGKISNFDNTKGLHFGTNDNPCGKVQLISDAFIAPESGETSIHRINVEASNASRNDGGVELSVYVNDVKIGETKTISSSASTMYSFETNEPLMGQIKIVLEDKSNDPAAMYIKGFEVYANVDETGTLLMPIVNALSQFKTCEIQAQDESFGTFLNSHQTTIEEHSNVLSGVKIYDYESEKTDYTGPKTFVTDFMSKYNLCLQRYNNVATSPVLQPMNSNNIIPIAIVMVAISSLMILSIGLVIRKRKGN